MRVKVWSGDGKEYLGEGDMVGYVPLYFWSTPDGNLISQSDAEEKPDELLVKDMEKEGCALEHMNNPKIILDDGTIKYGCQTYWKPIEKTNGQ